jgi:hypothetical protein
MNGDLPWEEDDAELRTWGNALRKVYDLEQENEKLRGGPVPNGHAEEFDIQERDFGAENTDPTLIEPRAWLLGNWFARGFVSSLIGDGGTGKTALRIASALSLATGRSDILGLHVFERVRVLFICFEDGEKELWRRIWAAMLHHNVTNEDIAGYLFVSAITNHQLKLALNGQFN